MAPLPFDLPAGTAYDHHGRDAADYMRTEGVRQLTLRERRIVPRRERVTFTARMAAGARGALAAARNLLAGTPEGPAADDRAATSPETLAVAGARPTATTWETRDEPLLVELAAPPAGPPAGLDREPFGGFDLPPGYLTYDLQGALWSLPPPPEGGKGDAGAAVALAPPTAAKPAPRPPPGAGSPRRGRGRLSPTGRGR